MFHLAAFTQSQDSAVLVPTAALLDQALQINGNDLIVPNDLSMLAGAYAFGPNAARVQLVAPSLRRLFPQELNPLDVNALPTDQLTLNWFDDNPLQLDGGEPFEVWMAENGAGATRVTTAIWLCDGVPVPLGNQDVRTIRVTSATAAVANVWSNIPLTFNDVLPSGTYALVGATLQSTNGQLARFVFKGGYYRPGMIMNQTVGQRQNPIFRGGDLGYWGTFENLTPPTVDVLCNGADAAFAGELDLVFLGR
jgi:hypothetical protein